MKKMTIFVLIAVIGLAGSTLAGDLYQVTFTENADSGQLASLEGHLVHLGTDGYLAILEGSDADNLQEAGWRLELIEPNVSIDQLAIDGRRDDANIGQFPLIYQEDEFRLFRVDEATRLEMVATRQLFPVRTIRPTLAEARPRALESIEPYLLAEDLESLIANVSQDSLISYSLHLQSFNGRVAGTPTAYTSRDWLVTKLTEFGYDSVVYDTFVESINGSPANCHNVIAYKEGTLYPDYKIIVGAHKDAVIGSPGADDNGSGTAGVLEVARILQSVDTDLSFEFILFDAEEWGLYGAYYYADQAALDGDNIEYMFNMDMIAHLTNSSEANLYHGNETEYTDLFIELADSLVGITGYKQGTSAGSDHYPFQMNGYQVTFLAERNFSTLYHSFRDSTTYMNFDYMTKMVKAGLATVYQVSTMAGPRPAVAFDFPSGLPEMMQPDEPLTLQIEVAPINGGTLVPGSPTFHYSLDGGSYSSEPMSLVTGDLYEAVLPAAECYSKYRYYVSAEETANGLFYDPHPDTPYVTISSGYKNVMVYDDGETDLGWGVAVLGASSGGWQRGVPLDDDSWPYDPATDGDGSGQCWLTQNTPGNTDVDGGSVRLTSPQFDFTDGGYVSYYYYLRLTNTADGIDRFLVEMNEQVGVGSWIEVARHTSDGGLDWRQHTITDEDIASAGLNLTSTMQVRITVNDDDPQSIVEAGFDGFSIFRYECEEPCCGKYNGGYTGNVNGSDDGLMTLSDVSLLIDHLYISKTPLDCPEAGNVNGSEDGQATLSDVSRLIDHIFISKLPTEPCP